MKTSNVGSWNELVFENRNHEYGAYVIRKAYSANVIKATCGCLLLIGMVGLYPRESQKAVEKIIEIAGRGTVVQPPPLFEKRIKPPPPAKSVASTPQVTKDPIPENLDDWTPPAETVSTSSDGNVGGSFVEAGGDGIVVDAPPAPPMIYDYAQVMPSYKGGLQAMAKYIQHHLKYPHSAKSIGIEGIVFVQFIINSDGKVVDAKVVRGIQGECDREAVRVIGSLPDWNPGSQSGSPVSVRMVLPINFRLAE
jgi:protein TonB